jgi:ABC-type transporter Mla subunit MlaD
MQWFELFNLLKQVRELLAATAPTKIRDLVELLKTVINVLNKTADFLDQFQGSFSATSEGETLSPEEKENKELVKAELTGLYQDLVNVLTSYPKEDIN